MTARIIAETPEPRPVQSAHLCSPLPEVPAPRRRYNRAMRVGLGVDVHAFASGRRLVLGGVEIPHERGLAGHSDADVLLHAIIDAMLGAAGLGDIGTMFPSS